MNNNDEALDDRALELLAAAGIGLSDAQVVQLEQFVGLVYEWNPIAGLVSRGDAETGLPGHLVDSLSLVETLAKSGKQRHVDIGSGGGFPALPLAVCLPGVEFLLLERGMRKCGFLVKATGALGLKNVTVEQIAFPAIAHPVDAVSLTARAVERPMELQPLIAGWMRPGDSFLNQSGQDEAFSADMFHVEHTEDAWAGAGIRRGSLSVVTRKGC